MNSEPGRPTIRQMFVTVGTDHHPFERLIGWAERWAERAEDWNVLVQHGRTRAPRYGTAFDFRDHDRMQSCFASANIVVSHGGPASISEARRLGHTPIVLPRDPARGEHVDDHQQVFVARLAAEGLVTWVQTEDEFLAAVVTGSYLPRQRGPIGEVPPGVFKVGSVIERVAMGGRRSRRH